MTSVNYFEFFGLPVAFNIDERLLKDKYYQNTRSYHPDHFGQEDSAKQAEMLEMSTLNNNAYKTLKDYYRRVHHILDLHGLVTEGDKHPLPPDFLMEMMDINEALMEFELNPDRTMIADLQKQVEALQTDINRQLDDTGVKFDAANNIEKQSLLLKVKEIYHKRKYILRLIETLHTFATP